MFQMPRVGFALLFGLITLARMEAQSINEAAAPLAARISSLLPRHTAVSLEFQVLTPLGAPDSSRFRNTLEEELRNQYSIGYTPPQASGDGKYHRIKLTTRDRHLIVDAREGYYAR